MITQVAQSVRNSMNSPAKISLFCLAFATASLVLNGTAWRIASLYNTEKQILSDIKTNKAEIAKLDRQLIQAKDPAFIERQALDKLDLVGENDLVFVFSDL